MNKSHHNKSTTHPQRRLHLSGVGRGRAPDREVVPQRHQHPVRLQRRRHLEPGQEPARLLGRRPGGAMSWSPNRQYGGDEGGSSCMGERSKQQLEKNRMAVYNFGCADKVETTLSAIINVTWY